ncbi:putative sporulation protein YtxC [Paenibacillus cremeus]|uniref:Putative sporulation protein YtxC n=1 Tax=Paenibacillus cremeus TaxID=2163881 RepID=A0A559JMG3_9BACL|nr:putative sporulation protein YtxC [Paenibacillus cremeus]TVY01075.1 putative sporulation protein YtxC [Paenibacillus cremeus]
MRLFTVHLTKRSEEQAERLYSIMLKSGDRLHNRSLIDMVLHRQEGSGWIEVSGILPGFQLGAESDQVYAWAGEAIADYLISEEEQRQLRSIIRKEFHYSQEEDIQGIIGYCEQMLSGAVEWNDPQSRKEAYLRRRSKISDELTDYLREQTELNLEGFLRFRLQAYLDELRDVVEYAVDEFVMDRQYQEFISLLKYFVYIQEAKMPFVHLIHKGGNEFMLLNDQMEPIDTDDADAVVTVEMLEKDMNFEDMIVSTLITVSPEQIYIHTREPELQVIQTISQIFENRVELCGYCRLCQNLDRGAAAEYNKG